MDRDELTRATYQVARELNQLKYRFGLIDVATYGSVAHRLRTAESVLADVEQASQLPAAKRIEAFTEVRQRLELANGATLCGEDEMRWPLSHRFHLGATLARGLVAGFGTEMRHTAARLQGRFDSAPFSGVRAVPYSEHPLPTPRTRGTAA